MTRLKAAFCILVFALAGCSNRGTSASSVIETDSSAGIVNGKDAKASDIAKGGFANSVVFVYDDGADCTGVLIAPTLVLTAAHCFMDTNPSRDVKLMSVKFQTLEPRLSPPQAVKQVIVHPDFKSYKKLNLEDVTASNADDLALMLLAQPAPATVHSAVLAHVSFSATTAKSVTTAGYGSTIDTADNDGADTVGLLRSTSFSTNDLGTMNGMILIKTKSSGVCHGDSGGPLFQGSGADFKNVIVGLNDFSLPNPQTFFEKAHWFLAEKTDNLAEYSDAYPDQDLCLGVNGFVDVGSHHAWILKAAASLGVSIP